MKPTDDTMCMWLLARLTARVAQLQARQGRWSKAAACATQAGDLMKKVQWELVE